MGWIDFVIVIVAGLSIWSGYHGGTVRAMVSIVGLIVGIEFASRNFQRFARELAPLVGSLEVANVIWFILQIFIVLVAFNLLGHTLQHEVGQMLRHDPGGAKPGKEKAAHKKDKELPAREHTPERAVHERSHGEVGHDHLLGEVAQQHIHGHAALLHGHDGATLEAVHGLATQGQAVHERSHGETGHEHLLGKVAQQHSHGHAPLLHGHGEAAPTQSHRKAAHHEVTDSDHPEEAWMKVSVADGVMGGLLGLARGIVLGCVCIMSVAAFFPGADTLPDAFLPKYLVSTTAVLANLTERGLHTKIVTGLEAMEPDPATQGNPTN